MNPAHPSNPPPLPSVPTPALLSGPGPAAVATPLFSVVLGLSALRLGAMMRPKTWIQIGVVACAFVVITRISARSQGSTALTDWVMGIFTLKILPLICLVTGGGFLRNEIRNITIEYIWTRPVRKSHLVLGAYASTVALVSVQAIVLTGLIYATASVSGIGNESPALPRLLLTQFACVVAYSGIAVALGVLTGKYMILGVFYGLVVELGISQIPTALNQLSVSHHALAMLQGVPGATFAQNTVTMLGAGAGCLVIAAAALSLAAYVFSVRQYGGREE